MSDPDAVTAVRARADQELAHLNTTLDALVRHVRHDLRDAGVTDVWALYAQMVCDTAEESAKGQAFAAEMVAAALIRLAQNDRGAS